MAIIHQRELFSWKDVENLGDLERLLLVFESLPDEKLIAILERTRKNGRNDYPIRAIWNSLLAGIVFQHKSIESLRRELQRNAQLREICGFNIFQGSDAVPPSWVYSRFLRKLFRHQDEIDNIFCVLVERLQKDLPSFGSTIACDSKAIASHARFFSKKEERDGRRDLDADVGAKTYQGRGKDGSEWKKTISWFGYKLHLFVDADYEIPLAYSVTTASTPDICAARKIIHDLEGSSILKNCRYFLADKAYDDTQLIKRLWNDHKIKAIIDIRDMWQDTDPSRLLPNQENVTYDSKGNIYCHCLKTGEEKRMAFGGFEKARMTLKYVCPAKAYGLSCACVQTCPVAHSIRVDMRHDRRIFTPVARSSYQWKRLYKARSSVERVNSRLDTSFCFEDHYIRGMQKMKLYCCLSLCIMQSMALGRIRQHRPELMRSLVKVA